MSTWRNLILQGFLSFTILIFLPNQAVSNTQPTPRSEIEASVLVSANSCFLPCWLGLVPGKSAVENALGLLKTLENYPLIFDGDELDPQTGVLVNGAYSLWWEHMDVTTDDALILIRERMVDQIVIRFNHPETLEQIINTLGYPSFGYLKTGDQLIYLDLFYLDLSTKIHLYYCIRESCKAPTIKQGFIVDETRFYSETALAAEIERLKEDSQAESEYRYYVPIEILQTWIDDLVEVNPAWADSWDQLTSEIPPLALTPSSTTLAPEVP